MKNHIDSNFAIAILALVAACVGFSFWFLYVSDDIAYDSAKSSVKMRKEKTQNINLPPDPGEEGMLTIEGIDSDGDGVRDDIQRWIVLEASDRPEVRQALTQGAKAYQRLLLDSESSDLSHTNRRDSSDAYRCLLSHHPSSEGTRIANRLIQKMRVMHLNTADRGSAYIDAQVHPGWRLGGFPRPEELRSYCDNDSGSNGK